MRRSFILRAHRGLAEDGADVEHAQAAHFEEVLAASAGSGLRACSGAMRENSTTSSATRPWPRLISSSAELALADARFAGDQHADAEHVHEHAVALVRLGQRLGEVARAASRSRAAPAAAR